MIELDSLPSKEERPNPFTFANMPAPVMFGMLMWMGAEIFEQTVTHPEVQKLMNSGEKFDVCVIEIFNTEALTVSMLNQSRANAVTVITISFHRDWPIILIVFLSLLPHLVLSSGQTK